MKTETEYVGWLTAHLDTVSLGDEEFVEYVMMFLKEPSIVADEKRIGIQSYLDAAAEVDDSFVEMILEQWSSIVDELEAARRQKEDKRKAANTTQRALTEAARGVESIDLGSATGSRTVDPEARRRLLQQYGYESDEDSEDDDKDAGGNGDGTSSSLAAANRNAVKEVQDKKKDDARNTHIERVTRDKAALEKDRKSKQEKKEARQKAAQKGERRR